MKPLFTPPTFSFAAATGLLLTLAACGGPRAVEPADGSSGHDTDPAVTSALEDPILVDPALTQQSHKNAVRLPESPLQAFYPPETTATGG